MADDSVVYFKGIDFIDLVKKYLNGDFKEITSPLPVDIELINEKPKSIITMKQKSSFEYNFGIGTNFALIGYKAYGKDGKYAEINPNKVYNCMYCLRPIKENPIGIPIHKEEKGEKKIYHMIDIFCSFECCYAEYINRLHNTIYAYSYIYLCEIFSLVTGKNSSELKPAKDKRLLQIFNGDVTWEEYHNNTTQYREKVGNLYFLPVTEYIEADE